MRQNAHVKGFHTEMVNVRGIALIEAIIALAVILTGAAAVFGVHSYVVGSSAESRLESAAMGVAQAKLEEFRSQEFEDLAVGGPFSEAWGEVVTSPGLGRNLSVDLTQCWTIVTEPVSNALLRVQVSVVRTGTDCVPGAADALASLQTLIAADDRRFAARNAEEQRLADGDGRIDPNFDITDHPEREALPGGFEKIVKDGEVIALINPDTVADDEGTVSAQALVPKDDGPLKFAQINGNIFFDSLEKAASEIDKLKVQAEGAAFCRVDYPGYGLPPQDGVNDTRASAPSVTIPDGLGEVGFHMIRYSCVVADQWRRAIFLTKNSLISQPPSERVCVGHPGLTEFLPDATTDVLLSRGRQYGGRAWADPAVKSERIRVGVRGEIDTPLAPNNAVFGSVCTEEDQCWGDPLVVSEEQRFLQTLVPGGHHFFVTDRAAQTSCADAMLVLEEVDLDVAGALFFNMLSRNPDRVYCTNDKSYTVDILSGDLVTAEDCVSFTRVSGFLTGEIVSGSDIRMSSPSDYRDSCVTSGGFNEGGGGYVCGLNEDANAGTISAVATGFTTDPQAIPAPLPVAHDIVKKDFHFVAGPAGQACAQLIVSGSTEAGSTISMTEGGVCGEVADLSYSCTASDVPENTLVTVTASIVGEDLQYSFNVAANNCAVTHNFSTTAEPSTCSNLVIEGSRKKGVAVTLDGVACAYPRDRTYKCTRAEGELGRSYTVRHPGSGKGNDKTEFVLLTSDDVESSGACKVQGIDF